jgi:hypothetical protein
MYTMPDHRPEISAHSVVLLGNFNPAIFHPQWFARQGLIREGEADDAKVQVNHPQLSQFETEQFLFLVTLDKFTIVTRPKTSPDLLRDLVLGTFYILEHTPMTALGMNQQMHVAMASEEAWHRLGDKLAPKEAWSPLLPERPGLRSLDVTFGGLDPKKPSVTVRVQPSLQMKHGVYFEVNHHRPALSENPNEELQDVLKTEWDNSRTKGDEIVSRIIDWSAD